MKSKIWPRRPRKWPRRPRGSQKGLSEFFQKIHFLNQGKALRKMSYSLSYLENFHILNFQPPASEAANNLEIWKFAKIA